MWFSDFVVSCFWAQDRQKVDVGDEFEFDGFGFEVELTVNFEVEFVTEFNVEFAVEDEEFKYVLFE